ncbi:unnamed protein product [Spirodela intermedia]|uniref:Uncharacterized protein n=2 Tax=Spirodela intermedia TaxID=51605 RepID=A0A7I8K059_SPIIN|nr:unnamed protein product [Spirodela intermedia]CAA6654505.1 unnamed protein product [Spirodela intermedia]CAA7389109.1 unnamed protein product [Spirodela intermedia]
MNSCSLQLSPTHSMRFICGPVGVSPNWSVCLNSCHYSMF